MISASAEICASGSAAGHRWIWRAPADAYVLGRADRAAGDHVRSRAIFARIDGAEQELAEIAGRREGRLRLGSVPTALATFVPAAFRRFRRGHGHVTLTVVDDALQRLLPRLEAAELDVALIYEHPGLPEVAGLDLDRTPLLTDL